MPWRGEPVPPESLAEAATDDPGRRFGTQDYWDRVRPHLRDFGISRVADITGLDRLGLPVAQAVRPGARSNAVTQGKARTLAGAAVSAVLECLEMAAGEVLAHLPPAPPGSDAIWRALAAGADWPVCDTPFVAAWDRARGQPGAVPRDLISSDFTLGAAASAAPILRHSIGLGAGASMAAALFHGLLECIEGDARLRAEAGGRARRLRLSDGDPVYGDLLTRLEAAGLRVRVEDITARPGPIVVAASIMEAPAAEALPLPAVGFAARLAPGEAIAAALMEAMQARLAVISGAREDLTQRFYAHGYAPEELEAEWERHGPRPGAAPPEGCQVATVAELAQGLGPVYGVPLVWRPDIPMAVTRVVAPALVADPLRLRPGP